MEKRILTYATVLLLATLCWMQYVERCRAEQHRQRVEEHLRCMVLYVQHPIHPLIKPDEWIYKWNQVSAMWNNFIESDSIVIGYAYGKSPGKWVEEFEKEYCGGVSGCPPPEGRGRIDD